MAKIRLYFKIFGKVQEVGFRYYLCGAAKTLGLSGWARNNPDGAVEGEVEGEKGAVSKFLHKAEQGPDLARVVKVEKESRAYENNFRDFEIKSL